MNSLYQNNEELEKIELASNVAVTQGQSEAISDLGSKQELVLKSPNDIENSVFLINKYIHEIRRASTYGQLDRMDRKRILSTKPCNSALYAAHIATKNLSDNENYTYVLVPGRGPIPINADGKTASISGVISRQGIQSGGAENITSEPSLPIDANVVRTKIENITNDKNIEIAKNKVSNALNKIETSTKDLGKKIETSTKDLGKNIESTLNNWEQKIKNWIVPYTEKLNVMIKKSNVPETKLIETNTPMKSIEMEKTVGGADPVSEKTPSTLEKIKSTLASDWQKTKDFTKTEYEKIIHHGKKSDPNVDEISIETPKTPMSKNSPKSTTNIPSSKKNINTETDSIKNIDTETGEISIRTPKQISVQTINTETGDTMTPKKFY
jgi:hypothetical protein